MNEREGRTGGKKELINFMYESGHKNNVLIAFFYNIAGKLIRPGKRAKKGAGQKKFVCLDYYNCYVIKKKNPSKEIKHCSLKIIIKKKKKNGL